jgi:adenylate cyclase
MFTDTVGYTASAQTDEARSLALLHEQEELVRPLIRAHQGREIKSTGDGFLVEFDSALRAIQCAVNIQRRLHERNVETGVSPIQIRIGIHLGDVVQHRTDILGDAVNIASRIEPVAEPGGICLSGAVLEQVRNKIPEKFEKLPPTPLKGLHGPMDVFRVVLPWTVKEPTPAGDGPTRLAVLPFTNISPDSKDEYFADGLTEELITILAELPTLLVIARTSVIQYKSTSKSVAQIGAELAVNNIVEGSVRKAGDQLRITVQLIDVATQGHLWAHTYDRKLDDVFAVQTEVARRIAEGLKIKTGGAVQRRLEERPTVQPESYLAYLKGRSLFTAEWSEVHWREAKKQFELALSLDSKNARALSGLADVTRYLHYSKYDTSDADWDRHSREYVARAIELDPGLAEGHCTLASILWDNFEYAEAEKEYQLALSLNPSYAQAHHWYGCLLLDEGRMEEALREMQIAEKLDPQSLPSQEWHFAVLGMLRRWDQVETVLDRLRELNHDGAKYHSALAYYHLVRGEYSEALRAVDREEALDPQASPGDRIWTLALTGQIEAARRLIAEAEARETRKFSLSQSAIWYAAIGDLDACFRRLNEAVEQHDVALQLIRNEPLLEPLRRDSRFGAVLKRMNLA